MKGLLKEFPFCVTMLELKSFGSDSFLLFDKRKLIATYNTLSQASYCDFSAKKSSVLMAASLSIKRKNNILTI